ncbi:hypothetical protein [Romboutsia lituseburensis]|uniref:hypothetical protein n=1 Tax=Romboutsia lituseburensis TaxID=1537 RepID=UPI0022EB7D08|nr:hypothetical protein [Romboutsia lituseburensis]
MDLKDKKIKDINLSTFTKSQIINSEKYRNRRDLLTAILEEDKNYSVEHVNTLIDKFMKSEVK